MSPALPMTEAQRFWARVDRQAAGCWLWTGSVTTNGYGAFQTGGVRRQAHRFAYLLELGQEPSAELDHLCRNRRCVRPDHLEPVTHRENVLRGLAPPALNARKVECLRGHPLHGANLYVRPNGSRQCRTCTAASRMRYEERRARCSL